MSTFVPPGFTRCPDCGEFNGRTRARYLNWQPPVPESLAGKPVTPEMRDLLRTMKAEIARTIDPEEVISVTCLCHGPFCRRCGVRRIHRPGSNSYEQETNTIGHWPVIFGMAPCQDCLDKLEAASVRT